MKIPYQMDTLIIEVVRKVDEPWGFTLSYGKSCFIDYVEEDTPVYEAGLQKGDEILSVNGVEVSESSHQQIVRLFAESQRIVRLKVIPNYDNYPSLPNPYQQDGTFWTDEDPSILYSTQRSDSEVEEKKEDNNMQELYVTEFENLCNVQHKMETQSKEGDVYETNDSNEIREATARKKQQNEQNEETQKIEQSKFVVKRETQKDFDLNYVPEGTFQGRKASVAGAFTGDHNQILGESNDDVRGIRSRVTAGIQHFSFEDEQVKIKAEERGKIILYTTSLTINRSVSQRCEQVRNIFKGFRVKFEDRDIFSSSEHKTELYQRLGLHDGAPFPDMPRVYLDGVFIGGAAEVQAMSDCGDLRIRLKEFTKFNIRAKCPTCNATGSITCHSCQGATFRRKNRFAALKCSTCSQKGFLPCPDCL